MTKKTGYTVLATGTLVGASAVIVATATWRQRGETPGPHAPEKTIFVPESVLENPEVREFVEWLGDDHPMVPGARVDTVELLAQLMIARYGYVRDYKEKVPELRQYFMNLGVPDTALTGEASRAAAKAWFEGALKGSYYKDRQHRLVQSVAEGGWGITITPPPRRPISPEELRTAQLRVLVQWRDCEHPTRNHDRSERQLRGELQETIDRYVDLGMPREAFELPAMREAAARATADEILARPVVLWPSHTVARSVDRFFIDGDAVYAYLPRSGIDYAAEFESYRLAPGRGQEDQIEKHIRSAVMHPDDVRTIIQAFEVDENYRTWQLFLHVMGDDWSSVGRDYLYSKLLSEPDPQYQAGILHVLYLRRQFVAEPLRKLLDRTNETSVLENASKLADTGFLFGPTSNEAYDFLLENLSHDNPDRRVLAAKVLGDSLDPRVLSPLLAALKSEQDSHTLAGLLGVIHKIDDEPETIEVLFDLLEAHPSLEVRAAAIEALPLSPIHDRFRASDEARWRHLSPERREELRAEGMPLESTSPDNQALIARARAALGPNAPPALRQTLNAKVAEYEQNKRASDKSDRQYRLTVINSTLRAYAMRLKDQDPLTPEERADLDQSLAEAQELLGGSHDSRDQRFLDTLRDLMAQIKTELQPDNP